MRVILRDKSELVISEADAKMLETALLGDPDKFVRISGQLIRVNRIVEIRSGGIRTTDVPDFAKPALDAPKHNCALAGTSIQAEIHRRALKQYPKDWPKYVRDKAWREKTRLAIRADNAGKKWCDYRADEHACEDAAV